MEKTEQPRRNAALQSGAGADTAAGQDAREFGQGGQTIERPLESGKDDRPDRDPQRDESIPAGKGPSRSGG